MPARTWPVRIWPLRWWARQSLRARLTLLATALFTIAVATGAVLVLVLQHTVLVRVLDSSAQKTATDIAQQIAHGKRATTVVPTTGGVLEVQVLDAGNRVVAASPGADRVVPVLDAGQVRKVRAGARLYINTSISASRLRVLAAPAGADTVLVVTDPKQVDDSVRILREVALIGGPLAVLLMAVATYAVAALTLRPVAALRHGAADIASAGLADQRLPVSNAQDEIQRLALTLNAMLDRIDTATKRQRTFVGDAAHELRSPLASLRVQLEVAQRLGPAEDLPTFIADVLVDVERLERLVGDLLALARQDEAGGAVRRSEPVALDELVDTVVAGYLHARVPVTVTASAPVSVDGDADGLRRVAVNLAANAVRHARAAVSVSLERGMLAGRSTATLRVTDDGAGIPSAERERVFDRFYRLAASRSRESGGTGLGLSIVRDLVRAHGGSVRLTPRDDGARGLQATVILPARATS